MWWFGLFGSNMSRTRVICWLLSFALKSIFLEFQHNWDPFFMCAKCRATSLYPPYLPPGFSPETQTCPYLEGKDQFREVKRESVSTEKHQIIIVPISVLTGHNRSFLILTEALESNKRFPASNQWVLRSTGSQEEPRSLISEPLETLWPISWPIM